MCMNRFRYRARAIEHELAPNLIDLSIIPWFHGFGCITFIGMMIYRSRIVVVPKFSEVGFLEAIQVRL